MATMSQPANLHHARGLMLMLASVVSFTANVLLVRALQGLNAANIWLVSCARFVVGLALIYALYRKEFQPSRLLSQRKLIERGVVGGFGVYLTYLTVVKLGAGRATFIGNTYVIWGALLAAWWLKERLRGVLLLGSAGALVGLALLTNVFASDSHPSIYDLVAIVASLCSAWVVVTIRQLHATEHTSTIFAAQCVYGLVICTGPAVATFQPISAVAWAVILLTSLTAGAGQLTMTRAFRDLPVAEGSLLQMLVPLGVAGGGMLFFHEIFSVQEWIGAILILAGTGLTAVRR